ncbi:efflux RND transporter periplasmic adaptor subunit [Geofilum sp. OHC36d9]|uniref:efflux RND transporter periplasmic adaptor subunit n=1 Tax=Geofilum sp. OHC36d9 TaxID=3458413 RepID=UPI004034A6BB
MNSVFRTVVVCSAVVVMAGCGSQQQDAQQGEAERTEIVKVSPITKQKVSREIELSTTLEGYETVKIAPSVTGNIEHIYVEVGSAVNAGDLLVRMNQNQLNTTKLAFANSGVEFERIKVLHETGTVSQQTYDQTELAYKQTKENLDFLEANTFVKAPFRGVISAKNYEDGELYSGNPILELTQTHLLKALIAIPELYIPYVQKGMDLKVTTEVFDKREFPANIEIVYPTIDPNTHTFQVKIKIPNSDNQLRPGMYVRTTLQLDQVDGIMVPYQSILKLTGSNERYVFINDGGVAKRVSVTLGKRFDDLIEIFSDELKVGDELVTMGQAKLINGIKLKVVE